MKSTITAAAFVMAAMIVIATIAMLMGCGLEDPILDVTSKNEIIEHAEQMATDIGSNTFTRSSYTYSVEVKNSAWQSPSILDVLVEITGQLKDELKPHYMPRSYKIQKTHLMKFEIDREKESLDEIVEYINSDPPLNNSIWIKK